MQDCVGDVWVGRTMVMYRVGYGEQLTNLYVLNREDTNSYNIEI